MGVGKTETSNCALWKTRHGAVKALQRGGEKQTDALRPLSTKKKTDVEQTGKPPTKIKNGEARGGGKGITTRKRNVAPVSGPFDLKPSVLEHFWSEKERGKE